jgi:hypothetical protein
MLRSTGVDGWLCTAFSTSVRTIVAASSTSK